MPELKINNIVLQQYKDNCHESARVGDYSIDYKIKRMIDLGRLIYTDGESRIVRYHFINLLITGGEVTRMWKDKNSDQFYLSETAKEDHKKNYYDRKEKENSKLIYNKLLQYKNKGQHKSYVGVDKDYNIVTGFISRQLLPLFAKEMANLVNDYTYIRTNPYRFDIHSDRHIYIEYAEPRNGYYELHRKMIVKKSHAGNFKIPKDVFLFDVLDYLVSTGMLDKDYNFIGKINEKTLDAEIIPLVDEEQLESEGFIFPN